MANHTAYGRTACRHKSSRAALQAPEDFSFTALLALFLFVAVLIVCLYVCARTSIVCVCVCVHMVCVCGQAGGWAGRLLALSTPSERSPQPNLFEPPWFERLDTLNCWVCSAFAQLQNTTCCSPVVDGKCVKIHVTQLGIYATASWKEMHAMSIPQHSYKRKMHGREACVHTWHC